MKIRVKEVVYLLFFLLLGTSGFAENPPRGWVKESSGNPIEGAQIQLKNGNLVVTSGKNGLFTLDQLENGSVVTVSNPGYKSVEVTIKGGEDVIIVLEKRKMIQTALFEKELDAFNGSAVYLSGDEIKNIPAAQLGNRLTGRMAGLITVQSDGTPGQDAPSMYIRGRKTNAEGILILIDGQEGQFGTLQPEEIENVTILKDASAQALYGMRASNGVMLIETKKGRLGRPRFDVMAQAGYQRQTSRLNPVDAATYAEMYNEGRQNDGLPLAYSDADIQSYRKGDDPYGHPNEKWLDEILKKGTWVQRYGLNIDGGSKVAKYFISAGVTLQSGMFNTEDEYSYSTNTDFQRYNFRSNVDFSITKSTFLDVALSGRMDNNNYPYTPDRTTAGATQGGTDVFDFLLNTPANAFPKYYEDNGHYVDQNGNRITGQNGKIIAGNRKHTNPWAVVNRSGYYKMNSRYASVMLNGRQNLDMLTKGLQVNVRYSMDILSQQRIIRGKNYASYQLQADGTLFKDGLDANMSNIAAPDWNERKTTLEAVVGYDRAFGSHHVTGSFFYSQYEDAYDYTLPIRYQGIGGWFGYNYDNRYVVDFTFGYQGSYKFEKKHQFAFTPSLAIGWVISNEAFLKDKSDIVSFLKIRGSLGKLANDGASTSYAYLTNLQPSNNVMFQGVGSMSGQIGFFEELVANPNMTWETVKQYNVGLDARFFRNRLSLSGDFFEDYRTDMPITPQFSFSYLMGIGSGLTSIPTMNLGKVHSRGVEVSANWEDKIGDFTYRIGGNYSSYTNKLTDMDEPDYENSYMGYEGHELDAFFGLKSDGYYQNQAEIDNSSKPTFANPRPGDIRYKDLDKDGVIDQQLDRTRTGYGFTPKVFYGFVLGGSYKGFDLNVLFQGAGKVGRNIGGNLAFPISSDMGAVFDFQQDRWSESNPNAAFPRMTAGLNPNSNVSTDFWIKDASYLRLKNVEFGYTLPRELTQRIRIDKLRLFFSGYNLATLVDHMGGIIDPEMGGGGNSFPIPQVFNFGLNVEF